MPSEEHSNIWAEIIITSTFIKLTLKDYGQKFDLNQELQKQEAFKPNSKLHKGLSLVNKITPELYQEDSFDKNIVIMIKREGSRPLKLIEKNNIIIFELGNGKYLNENNLKFFIERLNAIKDKSKILLDFDPIESDGEYQEFKEAHYLFGPSFAIREIRQNLERIQEESNQNIAICGLDRVPFVIKEYFEASFPVFYLRTEAMFYLSEQ